MAQAIIPVARVGSPFGIDGDLVLHCYSEAIEDILKYENWWFQYPGGTRWEPLHNEAVYELGNKYLIRFDGYHTRDQARALVNAEIGVARADFPELSEDYYWVDLIGLTVVNHRGVILGHVTTLFETGANDVLVLEDAAAREILVPFAEPYIIRVDTEAGYLEVEWEADY